MPNQTLITIKKIQVKFLFDGNQVEDAQAHDAQAHDAQVQEGAQAQRITRSMARALGKECQMMTLLISLV